MNDQKHYFIGLIKKILNKCVIKVDEALPIEGDHIVTTITQGDIRSSKY